MNIQYLLDAAEFLESHSSLSFEQKTVPVPTGDFFSSSGSPDSAQTSSSSSSTDVSARDPKIQRRFKGRTARENHNALEKGRRAYLRDCFAHLRDALEIDDPKCSNLSVLRGAIRCIQTLKLREKNLETETATLARRKIELQQRIGELKRDLCATHPDASFDVNLWLKMHVSAHEAGGGGEGPFDEASRASGATSGDGKTDDDAVTTSTVSIDENSKDPVFSEEEEDEGRSPVAAGRSSIAALSAPAPSTHQQQLINVALPPDLDGVSWTERSAGPAFAAGDSAVAISQSGGAVLNVVETTETDLVSPQRLAYVTADGLIIASDHELVRQGTNIIFVQTSNLPS